uniref:Uncharacterized protein n=1 Tax=Anguilla anguilla TaxID=7936 RepID=A0A0E9WJB3_ANGAN
MNICMQQYHNYNSQINFIHILTGCILLNSTDVVEYLHLTIYNVLLSIMYIFCKIMMCAGVI